VNILWFTWKDRQHPLAGGAEIVNEELAKRLAGDGHHVTLVVGGFAGAASEATIDGYKIIRLGNRYTLYPLAYRYYKQHLVGWADVVIDEVNTLPFCAKFYVKEPVIMLYHQLCREVWFHEMIPPLSWAGYLIEPLYVRLLSSLPAITISESTKQDLVRFGYDPKKVHIISEGIQLQPAQDLGKISKYRLPTVLSLGALKSMKRTLHHIEAFELAKQRIPGLQLKIAGGVQEKYGKKVLARIAVSPFKTDIEYLGRVSAEQKLELMQKSHVLIQTAVREGWGLTITEAASQGTPAVVYDVAGLRDSVRHHQTGLITAATPRALADGIVQLLQSQALYQTLRQAAWEWSKTVTFEQCYRDFKQAAEIA